MSVFRYAATTASPRSADRPGRATGWAGAAALVVLSLGAQAAATTAFADPVAVGAAVSRSGSPVGTTTQARAHASTSCQAEQAQARKASHLAKHAKHGKRAKRAAARRAKRALRACRQHQTARPATAASVAPVTHAVRAASSTSTTQEYRPITGFYGPNSEWTRDVSAAPLAPDSSALVQTVAAQVASKYAGTAAFNAYNYSRPFYTVGTDTPKVTVQWNNCQGKRVVPPALYDPNYGAQFVDVPIPSQAIPAPGTDAPLTIWDPAADKLWEFWKAQNIGGQWYACWGGRIDNWSQSPGYFTGGLGVSASGLSTAAGSIGMQEAQAGQINHAVALSLISTRNATEFSYPAQRSDGNLPVGTAGAVAEGQRFRLDPSLDVDSLHLTPLATMIAKAAQKYGFVVVDRSGAVAVAAESSAGLVDAGGTDPWATLMAGKPAYQIMQNFPWSRLQALPWNYGQPGQ